MNTTIKTLNDLQENVSNDQMSLLIRELPMLTDLFDVHYKVGEGTFSSVYLATIKSSTTSKKFAIKHLIPTYSVSRVERELKCLQEIGGADNIVGLDLCIRHGASIAFIMPFMRHNKFCDYVDNMDRNELKQYMRALMIALRKVHIFNIIHRDVKPSNFLYDRANRKYLLVDFGLAQEYVKKNDSNKTKVSQMPLETVYTKRKRFDENSRKAGLESSSMDKKCCCFGEPKICSLCITRPAEIASRAGTPGFRAPEVLLKHSDQSPAIDVWASGIIMLCILSATHQFFRSPDDCTALAEIISVFGNKKMQHCARKLGKKLICSENCPGIDLKSLCEKLRRRRVNSEQNTENFFQKDPTKEEYPPEAYDLLTRLLDVDHTKRITAEQALEHPFLKAQ